METGSLLVLEIACDNPLIRLKCQFGAAKNLARNFRRPHYSHMGHSRLNYGCRGQFLDGDMETPRRKAC